MHHDLKINLALAMLCGALLAPAGALAQAAEVANPDPKVEARLKDLAAELRCLVCQNQTIADSNAPLAVDLRQQIRGQIAEGASDAQILDYMVQRYGDFVLYRPPLRPATFLLWAGPFLLIALGALVFFRVVRRRREAAASPSVPASRQAGIRELLEKD